MDPRTWLAAAPVLLASFGVSLAAMAPGAPAAQDDGLEELDGEWIYVEDRTPGRAPEDQGPPMSPRLRLRVDEDAVVWVRARGREDRMPRNGSITEEPEGGAVTTRTGAWRDGLFEYETKTVRVEDGERLLLLTKSFEVVPEGMLVHIAIDPPDGYRAVALYQHPEDIELPTPAEAGIDDLAWLAGAWLAAGETSSTEERWSPPGGGAMLGVSRTVKNGRMVGFEYLRIVERDGGLVYVAQPGGNPPTEFVLTGLGAQRAVFDNPRHDSPQRIVYELTAEGRLVASVGFLHGGRPHRFEFARADD